MSLPRSTLTIAILTLACQAFSQHDRPSMVGRPAPAWEVSQWFQLPAGKRSLTAADFKGKVVYLFCFQSWCPGCHSQGFPTLKGLVGHYRGEKDVAFVAVQTVFEGFSTNTLASAKRDARHYHLDIPFGHDAGPDGKGSRLMRAYHTRGTPWTIVIDAEGIVRYSDFFIKRQQARHLIDGLLAVGRNPLIGKPFGSLDGLRWLTPRSKSPTSHPRKLTLYRWWTDTCPHCRASLPALSRLARKYRGRGLGLVAVYHRKSPGKQSDEDLRAYLRGLGYQGEVAVDPRWRKLRELMGRAHLERATSVSFLVDRQGIVRWVHPGPRIHRSEDPRYAAADADMRALESLLAERLGPSKMKRERARRDR